MAAAASTRTSFELSSSSERIEKAEESGDVDQLLEIIETCAKHGGDDDWTEAAEESLDALFRLAKGGGTVFVAGVATLFGSLSSWKKEDAVVEVALGCIVAILAATKSYKVTKEDEDRVDVSILWTLLKDFPEESTIQEQACLAIEGVALASPKWKDALLKNADCEDAFASAELKAAQERITNERNKAYPRRAAEALGVSLT